MNSCMHIIHVCTCIHTPVHTPLFCCGCVGDMLWQTKLKNDAARNLESACLISLRDVCAGFVSQTTRWRYDETCLDCFPQTKTF